MSQQGQAIKLDPRAVAISFPTNDILEVKYMDGRVLRVPLAWSHRLARASDDQRYRYEIWDDGRILAWPEIDEHIDAEKLLTADTLMDWSDDADYSSSVAVF
ncbi:MAG: DUF2442 domain-containing protein [Peptococcaceae bacterium]|nr:DUF2442 domain-containing protein [Peptococcaceae bacterium]